MSDSIKLADAVLEALEECARAGTDIATVDRELDRLTDAAWREESGLNAKRRLSLLRYDEARLSLVRAIREAAKPIGDDE